MISKRENNGLMKRKPSSKRLLILQRRKTKTSITRRGRILP